MPMAFSQVRSTNSSSSLKMRLPEQEGELYVRRPYRKLDLWRIMDLISKRPKNFPLFVTAPLSQPLLTFVSAMAVTKEKTSPMAVTKAICLEFEFYHSHT